jgi:hypothetical protein
MAFWCADECRNVFIKHATALLKDRRIFHNTKSSRGDRPNARGKVKAVIIAAMRDARKNDQELDDFIAGMENLDAVLECQKESDGQRIRITVHTGEGEYTESKALGTLRNWWIEAGT